MAVASPSNQGTYQYYLVKNWDEREATRAPIGFQAVFGRPETGAKTLYSDDAEVVSIDVQRSNGERTAVLVPRGGIVRSLGSLQKSQTVTKFTNQERVYPLSIELFDIHSSQLNKRLAGEPPGQPWSREKRLRQLVKEALMEGVKRTVRMFEILAAQSVETGKQDAIIGTADTDLQYDWQRKATHSFTASTLWSAATPDIPGDLDTACDLIRQDAFGRGDVALMGSEAIKYVIKNSDVQTLADNRRYQLVAIGKGVQLPSKYQWLVDAGWDPRGYIETYKGRTIWLFTYEHGYTNSSGTWTNYMPTKKVIVFDSSARCDRYFGPPETLPLDSRMIAFYQDRFGLSPMALPPVKTWGSGAKGNVVRPEMFHFDAYPNGDNTTITHRTQSAPIFGTTHVDSFVTITIAS